MGLAYKIFCLLSLVVLFPTLCSSQDPFICSRATDYGSPDCLGTPSTLSLSLSLILSDSSCTALGVMHCFITIINLPYPNNLGLA